MRFILQLPNEFSVTCREQLIAECFTREETNQVFWVLLIVIMLETKMIEKVLRDMCSCWVLELLLDLLKSNLLSLYQPLRQNL